MVRRAAIAAVAGTLAAGGLALEVASRPDTLRNRVLAAPGARSPSGAPAARAQVAQQPSLAADGEDRDSSFFAGQGKPPAKKAAKTKQFSGFAAANKAGVTSPGLLVAKGGPLTHAQARRHLLNRVTFGPRPSDVTATSCRRW